MTGVLAFGLAGAAGVVSFLSPCVLPLVPVYLSVISGVDTSRIGEGNRRQTAKVVSHTLMFISGFALVFVALGLTATSLSRSLLANRGLIERIAGVVILAMAALMLTSLVGKSSLLSRERRWTPDLSKFGPIAPPVAGIAFGFGWTPCIGPVLTSILALAATGANIGKAAGLMAAYSLGLGIPFLLVGIGYAKLAGALKWIKKNHFRISLASSLSLGVLGALLATNNFVVLTAALRKLMAAVGLEGLIRLG